MQRIFEFAPKKTRPWFCQIFSYNIAIRSIDVPAKLVVASLAIAFAGNAQTTLNLSEDVVRLGIASGIMVPNDPTIDAGPIFFRAVLYAKNHQIGRVIADRSAYYFQSLQYLISTSTQYGGSHVAWDSLSNMTIDLKDRTFIFPSLWSAESQLRIVPI
jgi:hypothetical protein